MNVVLAGHTNNSANFPKGNFNSPLIHEGAEAETYESYAWNAVIPNHPIFEGN